jgi:hypothetical protein
MRSNPERQGASAYGYGNYGYGYGYGGYDPAAAYAHYAEADPDGGDAAGGASRQQRRVTAAPKAPSSLRERVAQRRRQLMRWLDS